MKPQYIILKREKDAEKNICYSVEDVFNTKKFCISVDPLKKKIGFYQNGCKKLIKRIFYNDKSKTIDSKIEGIDPYTVIRIYLEIKKASEKNDFPEYIRYVSGG